LPAKPGCLLPGIPGASQCARGPLPARRADPPGSAPVEAPNQLIGLWQLAFLGLVGDVVLHRPLAVWRWGARNELSRHAGFIRSPTATAHLPACCSQRWSFNQLIGLWQPAFLELGGDLVLGRPLAVWRGGVRNEGHAGFTSFSGGSIPCGSK
jgi:hypothetical protein